MHFILKKLSILESNTTIKVSIRIVRSLAIICLFALFFSHLALTDIAHGELDLSSEWLIVQITTGLLVFFIMTVLVMSRKYAREMID